MSKSIFDICFAPSCFLRKAVDFLDFLEKVILTLH